MPREGYESITIPEDLDVRIKQFVEKNQGLVENKTQAVIHAWNQMERENLGLSKRRTVKIGNNTIGGDNPIFVIAEIGINHNGDLDLTKTLIDMAAEAGCHAVKFQKRTVDVVYTSEELDKPRESPWGSTNREQKLGLEFEQDEYSVIDSYCKERGILWFASPWDVSSVDFLEEFDVPCYKIASASLTDRDLLERILETGRPVILSTGLSNPEQIRKAVDILGEENLILLHCTSTYPCEDHELNLNVIKSMQGKFTCPIGYSGHETGVWPTVVAAALGASVIERHITIDRSMYGSDQSASLEKRGIELVCNAAKNMPIWLGDGIKVVYDRERPIIEKLRRVDSI